MHRYEIRSEDGRFIDESILIRYYGNFWQSVMNRLDHDHEGYLFTIHDREAKFRIFRLLEK